MLSLLKNGTYEAKCRFLFPEEQKKSRFHCHEKERAHKAAVSDYSTSDESDAMETCHVFGVSTTTASWIVDSGAKCQMCKDSKLFDKLEEQIEDSLGDGQKLKAIGRGNVPLKMMLPDGKSSRSCKLLDVLFVPKLSYNLLSVFKATKAGKVVEFHEDGCQIFSARKKLIAEA